MAHWIACALMIGTQARLTRLDYREVLIELGPQDVCYLDPPSLGNCDVRAYSDGMIDHRL